MSRRSWSPPRRSDGRDGSSTAKSCGDRARLCSARLGSARTFIACARGGPAGGPIASRTIFASVALSSAIFTLKSCGGERAAMARHSLVLSRQRYNTVAALRRTALQHAAVCCNMLRHVATCCGMLQHLRRLRLAVACRNRHTTRLCTRRVRAPAPMRPCARVRALVRACVHEPLWRARVCTSERVCAPAPGPCEWTHG